MKLYDRDATIRLLVYAGILGLVAWAFSVWINARIDQIYFDAI
jgi:hypothetical protein